MIYHFDYSTDFLNNKFSSLSQTIVRYHQVLYNSTGPQLEVTSGNKLLQEEKSNSNEGTKYNSHVYI